MKSSRISKHSKFVFRFEPKKNFFRKAALFSLSNISEENPYGLANYSTFFPRLSNLSRKKNFCVFTDKSRGVMSNFKISRIALRELASFGKIIGLKKSSW